MTLLRLALKTSVAALLLVPIATAANAPGQTAVRPASIPAIPYSERTLPNGLRVIRIPDKSTPNVSVQVWYDVGGKFDPPDRMQFSHLFEHLMFKATRNMGLEQFDRLTEDVGGFNSAHTTEDYTQYWAVVPAHHLERVLWAEAERMGSLVVDEAVFRSERDVVKEELRMRVLSHATGKLSSWYIPQTAFLEHPYGRGIGTLEELDAATLDEVRAFHAAYYRPDAAVLVVSGNFDEAALDRWVDRYFGPLKRPATPRATLTVTEPPITARRRFVAYEPNTTSPIAALTFHTPGPGHPDAPALTVLTAILQEGDSSRMYRALQHERQIASGSGVYAPRRRDIALMSLLSIMREGHSAAEGEAALREIVREMRDVPVTDAELSEAKNELLAQALRARETPDGRATEIGRAVLMLGSASRADSLLKAVEAVTAADVQRVARLYLRDEASVAVLVSGTEGAENKEPATPIARSPTIRTLPLPSGVPVRIVTTAPEAERVQPPRPGEPARTIAQAPVERRLANGLKVIVAPRTGASIVSVELRTRVGSASDPRGRAGTAALTADLLTRGAGNRTGPQIAREIEALGASLTSSAAWDSSSVSLVARKDVLATALPIFSSVARNPTFSAEDLERQRGTAVDNITNNMRNARTVATLVANRELFGDVPYGRPQTGTATSLRAIQREDLVAFHRSAWTASNAVLVFSGDISPDEAVALSQQWFGDWRAQERPAPAPALARTTAAAPAVQPLLAVNIPQAAQAAVVVATPGISRSDPDYYAALLANTVLGLGYSSRLNQEIRVRRGLSYGANTVLEPRRTTGPALAVVLTRNDAVPEVISRILSEYRRLQTEPPSDAELETRKAALIGRFGRRIETSAGLASMLAELGTYDIGSAELARYESSVLAVTREQVRTAAARLFNPERARIVAVGVVDNMLEALRAISPAARLVSIESLNFDVNPEPARPGP